MTITAVATGVSSRQTGNTSTTPGLPAGVQTGDLLIVVDSVVSYSGAGGPATPAGPGSYTQVVSYRDSTLGGFARTTFLSNIYNAGDSAPAIAYIANTGGTNDNHRSVIYGFRGATSNTDQPGVGSPISAATTTCGPITGFTTVGPGSLVILAATRDDQFTNSSIATGDGLTWNQGTDFTDATADAMSVLIDWAITTTPLTVTSKTITISNGNNAESAGIMWSFLAAGNPPASPLMTPTALHRAASW